MSRRQRLDKELVRRGLARSRDHAVDLVANGLVRVSGIIATKPSTAVGTDSALQVIDQQQMPDYVSRGGHKLAGAFDAFIPEGLEVAGKDALDAGASTGGFTDVLLRCGCQSVTAVDVGYGQLAWSLRRDDRVTVLERTHVNDLTGDLGPMPPHLVVADLSFISLTKVLPTLVAVSRPDADLVLLVKPQFEVGRAALGKGGVVRRPQDRTAAVVTVGRTAPPGWGVRDVCASPLPGPAGNVEYFVWLRQGAPVIDAALVARVVADGPQ